MSQNAPPQPPTTPARYLLDTNILARLTETTSPMHAITAAALDTLNARGDLLFIASQNVIEFWNLATRPALNNGMGLTTDEAAKHKTAFRLFPDAPTVFKRWEILAERYNVQGQQAHDTRLAAFALVYGVENVLTFNVRHFQRFAPEGLTTVDPVSVVAQ